MGVFSYNINPADKLQGVKAYYHSMVKCLNCQAPTNLIFIGPNHAFVPMCSKKCSDEYQDRYEKNMEKIEEFNKLHEGGF